MEIPPEGHYVTTGLLLMPEHTQAIDQVLAALRRNAPASLVVLTARDGQFISAAGENVGAIDVVALGSLIAGDLAASHQIARLTGEYEDFQVILRQGRESHMLVTDAGPQMALFVLTSGDVPVGWLRLLGMSAARLLGKIVETGPSHLDMRALGLDDKTLADQFGQVLGDLWQE
jgi:predicted regulator of Ras-like GTPase activity (Roadblock/LC7/MglB family)